MKLRPFSRRESQVDRLHVNIRRWRHLERKPSKASTGLNLLDNGLGSGVAKITE